jgi:hypothetical protein
MNFIRQWILRSLILGEIWVRITHWQPAFLEGLLALFFTQQRSVPDPQPNAACHEDSQPETHDHDDVRYLSLDKRMDLVI